MKYIKYFLIGIFFGIVLIKSEVVSWFRIQEMFHFQSFHMFGVIGGAVVVGALSVLLIRKLKLKAVGGQEIDLTPKPGDADADDDVDLDDFVILKRNFGATGVTQSEGDFDGDGDVDLEDFAILKANFGTGS